MIRTSISTINLNSGRKPCVAIKLFGLILFFEPFLGLDVGITTNHLGGRPIAQRVSYKSKHKS